MENNSGSLVGQRFSGTKALSHCQSLIKQGLALNKSVGQPVTGSRACPTLNPALCLSGTAGHRRYSILQGYIFIYIPDRLAGKNNLTHCFQEAK